MVPDRKNLVLGKNDLASGRKNRVSGELSSFGYIFKRRVHVRGFGYPRRRASLLPAWDSGSAFRVSGETRWVSTIYIISGGKCRVSGTKYQVSGGNFRFRAQIFKARVKISMCRVDFGWGWVPSGLARRRAT